MTDPLHDLEQSLRSLNPTPPSPQLDTRIANALSKGSSPASVSSFRHRGDRLLLTTLAAAAPSLLLIITLLTSDYLNSQSTSSKLADDRNLLTPTNTQRLLAQLSGDTSHDRIP